ncbi:MAG TPA: hypothetical protein VLE43_03075 [Candidatus Saccharimonadia bacterium]|nr:hypothetical protein [Candidatus Saccharimonadia bacterium]
MNSSAPSVETLKRDVRTLADDTVKMAQSRLVEPTREAAQRVSEQARKALDQSRERMNQQLAVAEKYASRGYDQTTTWIAANPLAAVGVAMAAGLLISSMFRLSSRR